MSDPTPLNETDYFSPEEVFEPNQLEGQRTVQALLTVLFAAGFERDEALTHAPESSLLMLGDQLVRVVYDGDAKRFDVRVLFNVAQSPASNRIASSESLSRQPGVRTSVAAQRELDRLTAQFRVAPPVGLPIDDTRVDIDDLLGRA